MLVVHALGLYCNEFSVYLDVHMCVRELPLPSLVDVRALASGAGRSRLGEGSRVQDPLRPGVHRCLSTEKLKVNSLTA